METQGCGQAVVLYLVGFRFDEVMELELGFERMETADGSVHGCPWFQRRSLFLRKMLCEFFLSGMSFA